MSHTLNAIDSDGVHYLLLDCTGREKYELDGYFGFNTFNPIKVNPLKKIVSTLSQEELNKLPSGNLKRNLVNLMGLNEMEDIVALDYSYDASLPTSDYKYPVVSFTPENEDDQDPSNLVDFIILDVTNFDLFINTPVPNYIHHTVIKLGEITEYKGRVLNIELFLGKLPTGQFFLYSNDEYDSDSYDLSYIIS